MLDLRFKTKRILQALRSNEEVRLFYRGKETGVILPLRSKTSMSTKAHPYFGSAARSKKSVPQTMRKLRAERRDLRRHIFKP